jgi:hypothetical protein
VKVRFAIARLPLMLRALVLVPLLAAGIDEARVSLVCAPGTQSCLETAGDGRFGIAGMLVLVGYALAVGALVARLARGRGAPPLLWIVATAGLWAACGGQALLASVIGSGADLGGGWAPLLAFGAAAGALLALALRALPALIRSLRPVAPRLIARAESVAVGLAPATRPAPSRFVRLARDRAPPAFA